MTGTTAKAVLAPIRWVAHQLQPEHARWLTTWPASLRIEIRGLGEMLFCHATPRRDTG